MSPTARTPCKKGETGILHCDNIFEGKRSSPFQRLHVRSRCDVSFTGRPQPHRVMRQSTVEPSGATHLRASCPFQMHAAREEQREALQTEDAGSTLYGLRREAGSFLSRQICRGHGATSFPAFFRKNEARRNIREFCGLFRRESSMNSARWMPLVPLRMGKGGRCDHTREKTKKDTLLRGRSRVAYDDENPEEPVGRLTEFL